MEDWQPLLPPGPILVGYSGGPDSTCLLHLLYEGGWPVAACHLNHSIHPSADEVEDGCRQFCEERGIPFLTGKADIPAMRRATGMGEEEAGRWARRAFFGQAKTALECSVVALAHTLDDQAETLLMNLTRGTSLRGLGGMSVVKEGIFRPLLGISKAEILEYCQEEGLAYVTDPSNLDLTSVRARLRSRVFPELAAINPQALQSFGRTARLIQEEDRFLNGMAAAALEQAENPLNGPLRFLTLDCEASFDASALEQLPRVLLARALRLAVEAVGGSLDFRQLEKALDGMVSHEPGSVTSDEGKATLTWGQERVHASQSLPVEPFRTLVTLPGETESLEFGWNLTAQFLPASWAPAEEDRRLHARLDRGRVQGQVFLRSVQKGDRMTPLGMEGSKLVSDVLSEMKLTKAAKARLPILYDFVGPLWVPGGPIAERAKVTSQSESLIVLTFEPAKS